MAGPAADAAERPLGRAALVMPQMVLAGGLIVFGAALFVLYGYCQDACNKPPWGFWAALATGSPWAVAGFALMFNACGRVLTGAGPVRALGLAAALMVLLIGGLLIADALDPNFWFGSSLLPVLIVGGIWLGVTALLLQAVEPPGLEPPVIGRLALVRSALTVVAGFCFVMAAACVVYGLQCEVNCGAERINTVIHYAVAGTIVGAVRIGLGRHVRGGRAIAPR